MGLGRSLLVCFLSIQFVKEANGLRPQKELLTLDRRQALGTLLVVFAAGVTVGATGQATFGEMWQRFGSVDDIPSYYFRDKVTISGIVTKVTDGDTLKVQHKPFLRSPPSDSLKIRLCAVDAPETAHFGKKGQPLGPVAKKFASDLLPEGKRIKIKLLSRDRYGRAVARISYRTGFLGLCSDDLSEALLREGLATVYTGGGAQYDGSKHHWDAIEAHAKAKRVGMWSGNDFEANDPKAYKKQTNK